MKDQGANTKQCLLNFCNEVLPLIWNSAGTYPHAVRTTHVTTQNGSIMTQVHVHKSRNITVSLLGETPKCQYVTVTSDSEKVFPQRSDLPVLRRGCMVGGLSSNFEMFWVWLLRLSFYVQWSSTTGITHSLGHNERRSLSFKREMKIKCQKRLCPSPDQLAWKNWP